MVSNRQFLRIPHLRQEPFRFFPTINISAAAYALFSNLAAPAPGNIRHLIVELRTQLGWSRQILAVILGVGLHTVRSWELGWRTPSKAAVRLVWLVHALFLKPESLRNGTDELIWWGQCEENLRYYRRLKARLRAADAKMRNRVHPNVAA
jgi:DNA-binding transcriptional regulator YiaG